MTIDIAQVRRDLKALWAAESVDNEHTIRAQTHNLIVYTEASSDKLEDTAERLIAMTIQRPGRVLLIHTAPQDQQAAEVDVRSFCRMVNKKQVCGELIIFDVGQAQRDELHSAVISLLNPNLPVYLWWDEPFAPDDHLADHLISEADRLLLDTTAYPDLSAYRPLHALTAHRLSDITWGFLTPWRKLLARLWDAGRLEGVLTGAKTITFTYNGAAGRAQALLLQTWLASRLGWELHTFDAQDLTAVWSPGGDVRLNVKLVAGEGGPADIESLTMRAEAQQLELHYRPQRTCVDVTFRTGRDDERTAQYPVTAVTRTSALTEELDAGYDPAYAEALQQLLEVIESG